MRRLGMAVACVFLALGPRALSEDEKAPDPLASFKFGAAIGASWYMNDDGPAIQKASLAGGLVRVDESATSTTRLLLELHRPVLTFAKNQKSVSVRRANRGFEVQTVNGIGLGPFVAVQSGANSVVDGIAFGAMVSLLRASGDEAKGDFNIGFGLLLDNKVQTLGDGIVPGMALPEGETEIRYKNASRWSYVLLISVGGN